MPQLYSLTLPEAKSLNSACKLRGKKKQARNKHKNSYIIQMKIENIISLMLLVGSLSQTREPKTFTSFSVECNVKNVSPFVCRPFLTKMYLGILFSLFLNL